MPNAKAQVQEVHANMWLVTTNCSQLQIHLGNQAISERGVPRDAIKDILGVDKRTRKYYIKAMQERKKNVLFTHLEKVSALSKEEER